MHASEYDLSMRWGKAFSLTLVLGVAAGAARDLDRTMLFATEIEVEVPGPEEPALRD